MDYQIQEIANFKTLYVAGEKKCGLVFFHGYGADAYDLLGISQIYQDLPRPHWFFPEGPQAIDLSMGRDGKAWFDIDFKTLQIGTREAIERACPQDLTPLYRKIDAMIGALKIPRENLFLGGFSQGATVALEVALTLPHAYAGLILFSAACLHEALIEKLAPRLKPMHFFQSHGEKDPLIPFSEATLLHEHLVKAGLVGKLHRFSGGHEIPLSQLKILNRFLHLEMSRFDQ